MFIAGGTIVPTPDDAFTAAVHEWFDEEAAAAPTWATYLGVHAYDHLLDDYSPGAVSRRAERWRYWLDRFGGFAPAALSPDNQVDQQLLRAALLEQLEDHELGLYERSPGTVVDVAINGVYVLLTREFAPVQTRLIALLGRLERIPALLEQGCELVSGRPSRGFTAIARQKVQGGIGMLSELIPAMAALAPDLQERLLAANQAAVAALRAYGEHLDQVVMPRSDGDLALGRPAFERRLRETHFLDYDADSLAEAGHELIRTTLVQLERLAREIDPARTWQALVSDVKETHPAAEDLVNTYRRAMESSRAFMLEQDLIDLPTGESLAVVETPAFMRSLFPYAAYQNPAPMEPKQTGTFFVTPVDPAAPASVQAQMLQGHSSLGIPVIALHEGYPGHHVQLSWANRNPSLVRKAVGISTLFAEGWAFYCEELMESLGYMSDPRARLMRLKDQLWRACRIVIDVGLHCRGMSVAEAEVMLVDVAKLEPVNAGAEVARYTMSPTQPMSYLIGKLELLKLAEEYRQRMGTDFRLKQFHMDLLSHGTIPPAMIRRLLFQ
jgi:uncharacterized protein (DUF885 family)